MLAERPELKPERDACGCFVEHVHGQSGQAFDVSLNSISYHEQSPRAGGKDRIAFVPYLCLISAAVLTCCSIFRFAVLEFFSPVFARLLFCSCYVPSFHT